jgi:hypothetical protein
VILVIFLTLESGSGCFAAGAIPAPKQDIIFDYSGPCKDLIGFWSGNLRDSLYSYTTNQKGDGSLFEGTANKVEK